METSLLHLRPEYAGKHLESQTIISLDFMLKLQIFFFK